MDLQAELKWIHRELDTVEDPSFIKAIKNMLKYHNKESSKRISIEQYNKEIDKSIAQIENGEFYTHEDVGQHIKKWAKK